MFAIYDKYHEKWHDEYFYKDKEICEKLVDNLIQLAKKSNKPYDYDIIDLSE
jgi:hypothetical protein